jgi:hypothetical protein
MCWISAMSNRQLPPDYRRESDEPWPDKLPRGPRRGPLVRLWYYLLTGVVVVGYLLLLYALSEIGRYCWASLRRWLDLIQ